MAKSIGVGQPAVSMMLARNCRQQKWTAIRLAETIDVSPEELWPGIKGGE